MYEVKKRSTPDRQIFAPQPTIFGRKPNASRSLLFALLSACSVATVLSGCGGIVMTGTSSRPTPSGSVLLSAAPGAVDFGSVTVGNSATAKVSVTNAGSAGVNISGLSLSGDAFHVDGEGKLPVSLAAGGSMSFNIHFSPNGATEFSGFLNVISDGSATPALIVDLHGKGTSAAKAAELSGLTCDSRNLTGAATDTCTVMTSTAAPSGGLLIELSSSTSVIEVPAAVTVPGGSSSAKFIATVSKVSASQTGTITATQGSITKSISVSLAPPVSAVGLPALTAFTCSPDSFKVAGHAACALSVSPAPSSSLKVALASTSSAISVPATVSIPSGSTRASFTANVAAVSTSQTVTVSATANASSESVSIQLKASKSSAPALSLSTATLDFGDVPVGKAVSKSITITSTGTAPATIKSASLAGAGFSVSGGKLPATLKQGESTALTVNFNPAKAGALSGQLLISSNAGTATVVLSGTGTQAQSAPAITAISCAETSITGSLADPCTVALSGPAPKGGFAIALATSDSAVTVPASVTVAAGTAHAAFTANIAAVTTNQSAVISASANGSTKSIALQLQASKAALSLSTTSLAFGNVAIGTAVSKSVTLTSTGTASVTIKSASIAGTGFSVSGASFPSTLKPGQQMVLTIQFDPTTAKTFSGTLAITSNTTGAVISLSGTGTNSAPVVNALTCASTSISGLLADSCKVSLSGSAPKGGVTVALASSSPAVKVPASLTIPATATSAPFTADVSAVSATQSVKVTAATGSTSKSISLQLNPALAQLSADATTVSFGAVVVGHTTTQVVTLTSAGKTAVTVKTISVTGASFSLSPVTIPATLNPGQTLSITLTFSPTVTGSQDGQLNITSNSSAQPTLSIPLSGTSNPHQVVLSWNAPSSGNISQYKVYRATAKTTSFSKLSNVGGTTYSDTTVQSGQSYTYYVTSVNSSGAESAPSNETTVTIP